MLDILSQMSLSISSAEISNEMTHKDNAKMLQHYIGYFAM